MEATLVIQGDEPFEVKVHGKFGYTLKPPSTGSVGYDLYIPPGRPFSLPHNCRRMVDTGVIVQTPQSLFMLLVPRSSTGSKRATSVRIGNTLGIIDPSYQGQEDTMKVMLEREDRKKDYLGTFQYVKSATNNSVVAQAHQRFGMAMSPDQTQIVALGDDWYDVFSYPPEENIIFQPGDRFAQVVFLPYARPDLLEAALEEFGLDRGGFGTSGE